MKKILIVEDEYYIQDIYKRVLTGAGYDVDVAVDGEEVLSKVKSSEYDLILLDIMLPKISGIEVLKRLRMPEAHTHKVPIFMITNLGQDDVIDEAFKIGADGYFIKAQLDPGNLVTEISKFIQGREKS